MFIIDLNKNGDARMFSLLILILALALTASIIFIDLPEPQKPILRKEPIEYFENPFALGEWPLESRL